MNKSIYLIIRYTMKKFFLSLTLCSFIFVSCNNSNNTMVKAEYSGEDIRNSVSINRNKDSKEAFFRISTDGQWILYSGKSVDEIDFSKPLLEGEGSGTFSLHVNDTSRTYFQVVTKKGKAILAEEHLPMSGGYNFRDLGGIKTENGKYVKWGKIFRSDDLHNLTDADLIYLSNIPLLSIVDFRSKEEIERGPDKVPASVKEDYALSISPGNLLAAASLDKLTVQQADSAMKDINRLLVTDVESIKQYKTMFDLLQNNDNVPLMFHCSAGKDRTGMGAALILSALGVGEDIIFANYMESNKYLADKYAKYIAEKPQLKPLFEVKPEFLKAGLDQIKKDHGSVENYLANVLMVDISKMRDIYLY